MIITPNRMQLGLPLVALALAACYRPHLADCSVQCGADHACPRGLSCVDSYCREQPTPNVQCMRADMAAVDDMAAARDLSSDCRIFYVSTAGDDANLGCTPAMAKKNISAAVAALVSDDQEVHVCNGTYVEEGLVVRGSLRGGYDCDSWKRPPSYGYPNFDGDTIVQKRHGANATATLVVTAGAALVDGFTIEGVSTGTGDTVAVELRGGRTTLSNNKIVGGTVSSGGAVGVLVDGDASADITQNVIHGGAGAITRFGSIGVKADSTGAVHIFGNTIFGGAGKGDDTGSTGVLIVRGTLTQAAGAPLENNQIYGDSGLGVLHYTAKGVAILSGSASVDIIGNQIDGGHANGGNDGTAGVYGEDAGPLRILGNRIYGGKAAAQTGFQGSWGINLYTQQKAEIANNMIHGGDAGGINAAVNAGLWTVGIGLGSWIQGSRLGPWPPSTKPAFAGAIIHHNTIIGGASGGAALPLFLDASGSVIENNIFADFADRSTQSVALFTNYCMDEGVVRSFQNNLTFNMSWVLQYGGDPGSTCTKWQQFTNSKDAENEIASRFSQAIVGGNVSIKPDCTGDPRCLQVAGCTAIDECFAALFTSWDQGGNGANTVMGVGLQLGPKVPCPVARSSLNLMAEVPFDLYGTMRAVMPSMGAHEFTGVCHK
jgi:hypothetical protein